MSIFSETYSNDLNFHFMLEYVENQPSRLFITVYQKSSNDITVDDLAYAIFHYCCGVDSNSLEIGEKEIPCEVRYKGHCFNMEITSYTCYERVLSDIASQISISKITN